MPMPFTFQDLIDAFYTGIYDEATLATPASPAPLDRAALTAYLKKIYERRFNRKHVLPADTDKCAETLGRITFVMYRAEANPETGDDPIDDGHKPTQIETRHIDLARESYGQYTNPALLPKPTNKIHGEIRLPGERGSERAPRETDKPCPLCT